MKYAQIEDSRKKDVLEWILKYNLTRQISAWITGDNGSLLLRQAFEGNVALSSIEDQHNGTGQTTGQ